MTENKFKKAGGGAYARATNVMSTQSGTDFEWSVKLIGTDYFYVGIASQLRREVNDIFDYDRNTILYNSTFNDGSGYSPVIQIGSNLIHSHLTSHKTGDIIRFRFKPKAKKLVIDLVRI